jgi:hypothetical protein
MRTNASDLRRIRTWLIIPKNNDCSWHGENRASGRRSWLLSSIRLSSTGGMLQHFLPWLTRTSPECWVMLVRISGKESSTHYLLLGAQSCKELHRFVLLMVLPPKQWESEEIELPFIGRIDLFEWWLCIMMIPWLVLYRRSENRLGVLWFNDGSKWHEMHSSNYIVNGPARAWQRFEKHWARTVRTGSQPKI